MTSQDNDQDDAGGLVNQDPYPRDARGRFAPGSTGNRLGRPRKGESLSEMLKKKLPNSELSEIIAAKVRDNSDGKLQYRYIKLVWDKRERDPGMEIPGGAVIILPSNDRQGDFELEEDEIEDRESGE